MLLTLVRQSRAPTTRHVFFLAKISDRTEGEVGSNTIPFNCLLHSDWLLVSLARAASSVMQQMFYSRAVRACDYLLVI